MLSHRTSHRIQVDIGVRSIPFTPMAELYLRADTIFVEQFHLWFDALWETTTAQDFAPAEIGVKAEDFTAVAWKHTRRTGSGVPVALGFALTAGGACPPGRTSLRLPIGR